MKRIKLFIAAMISAIAVVFMCATGRKLEAGTITAEFSANDLDADGILIEADAATPFYQNSLLYTEVP